MIWALIFSVLIATLTGGDSPYLLPKMDNIIKKHVQDDVRKDTLLLLIKETKIERKAFVKADKKLSKELNDLAQSRESTRQDFDNLIQRSHESRKKSNSANLKFINEAQKLITEAEWANMKPDFKKSILKLDKRMQKGTKQIEKAFNKYSTLLDPPPGLNPSISNIYPNINAVIGNTLFNNLCINVLSSSFLSLSPL